MNCPLSVNRMALAIFLVFSLSTLGVSQEPRPTKSDDPLDDQALAATDSTDADATRVACALRDISDPVFDQEQRDAEFRRLAQQVSILEQQAAVLRSVVKLVGPSVVHIEAEKEQPDEPTAVESGQTESGGPTTEEAELEVARVQVSRCTIAAPLAS